MRLFFILLKEKTAVPAIFIIAASLVNYFAMTDFNQAKSKLPISLAKASGVGALIGQNQINNDTDVTQNSAIYNKFLKNNFMIPTTGHNWGRLHGNNGVDIANACSNQIYAPEEGMVIESVTNGKWNGGYGNFVRIRHPNSVVTKYAHTKKNITKVGDYVLQGDPIAYIGNTGEVQGATGCHLHFEVEGAVNPFATRR